MSVLPVMRRCAALAATTLLLFILAIGRLSVASANQPTREVAPRLRLTDRTSNWAAVKEVAFSPDGKTLTSLSFSGELIFWNPQTGVVTQKWMNKGRCFRYAPDGKTIAIAIRPYSIQLRDAQTGVTYKTITSPPPGHADSSMFPSISCMAWSPDGSMLAVGTGFQTKDGSQVGDVRLWDIRTGEVKVRIPINAGNVFSVAFAPDGQTFAVGSGGYMGHAYVGSLTLCDTQTGNAKRSLVDPNTLVDHIVFAPDGNTLLYTHVYPGMESTAGAIEVRDTRTSALLWKEPNLQAATFSPDGQTVAGVEHGLRLMDAHTGQTRVSLFAVARMEAVAFSPDGSLLVTGGSGDPRYSNTLQLWDARTADLRVNFIGEANIQTLAFSRDGGTLLAENDQGGVVAWPLRTGALRSSPNRVKRVYHAAFSPDGTRVVDEDMPIINGQVTGTLRIQDIRKNRTFKTLKDYHAPAYSLSLSQDGKQVACGTGVPFQRGKAGGEVVVWDAQTGQQQHRFTGHSNLVDSVVFSPDGRWLASGCTRYVNKGLINGSERLDAFSDVRLWSLQKDAVHLALLEQTGSVLPLAFLPDNRTLIVSRFLNWETPREIQAWDIKTNILKQKWTLPKEYDALYFSSDAKTLVVADAQGEITLRDSLTGQIKQTIGGPKRKITRMALAPDGKTLAVVSGVYGYATAIEVWDVPGGRLRVTLEMLPTVGSWIAYTPDGYYNGSADAENFIQWQVDGQTLPSQRFPDRRQPQRVQAAFANPMQHL